MCLALLSKNQFIKLRNDLTKVYEWKIHGTLWKIKYKNDGTHELNLIQRNVTEQIVYVSSHEGILIHFFDILIETENKK